MTSATCSTRAKPSSSLWSREKATATATAFAAAASCFFFSFFSSSLSAAPIRLTAGLPGQVTTATVDAPNLGLPPDDDPSLPPLPAEPPNTLARPRPTPEPPGFHRPHLSSPGSARATDAGPLATLDEVIDGRTMTAALDLRELGTGRWTAPADGTVVIEPLLQTYDGAGLTVRLLEPDGTEALFRNKQLMQWERADDRSSSPLLLRGRADRASVRRVSLTDFSPRPGLRYPVEVRAGQTLVLELSGSPAPGSRLRLLVP